MTDRPRISDEELLREAERIEACGWHPDHSQNRIASALRELSALRTREAGWQTAWGDVLAERQRQVSEEGWTPQNDDAYQAGDLANAAACYALTKPMIDAERGAPYDWPWSKKWWKPTDRRRDLIKAGALILAEIERLDRAALSQPTGEGSA